MPQVAGREGSLGWRLRRGRPGRGGIIITSTNSFPHLTGLIFQTASPFRVNKICPTHAPSNYTKRCAVVHRCKQAPRAIIISGLPPPVNTTKRTTPFGTRNLSSLHLLEKAANFWFISLSTSSPDHSTPSPYCPSKFAFSPLGLFRLQ